jgi:hypothetical protein
LDIIFNLGADSSYIDKNTGLYVSKLSSDSDVYSDVVYNQLTSLEYHWNKLCEAMELGDGYKYQPDMVLSNQISDIVYNHISTSLSVEKLSGIETMYDSQFEKIDIVQTKIDELDQSYIDVISVDYPYYFEDIKDYSDTISYKIDSLSAFVYGDLGTTEFDNDEDEIGTEGEEEGTEEGTEEGDEDTDSTED